MHESVSSVLAMCAVESRVRIYLIRHVPTIDACTARSVEDATRNAELNDNRNPECWGDFSQLVRIEKIKYLGISRYKVELRF